MGQKVIISIATVILLITGVLLGYVLSQLVLGYLIPNFLTFLGTISLIVIFGTLYYVLFWEFRKQQSVSLQGGTSVRAEESVADIRLQNRLIAILDGDTGAVERLIKQAKHETPGMPENWYWERVIADVESDRW
ncbi:MAG: ABC transporter permease [Rhizonema sp. NSF051]|nr:ABC transporter permease [Rhizonema sp. NSF051]